MIWVDAIGHESRFLVRLLAPEHDMQVEFADGIQKVTRQLPCDFAQFSKNRKKSCLNYDRLLVRMHSCKPLECGASSTDGDRGICPIPLSPQQLLPCDDMANTDSEVIIPRTDRAVTRELGIPASPMACTEHFAGISHGSSCLMFISLVW